jgi:hypothetical protein
LFGVAQAKGDEHMTLHESLVSRAPVGVSKYETPGAFIAVVGKRADGGVRVSYHGKNDDQRMIKRALNAAQEFAQCDS